MATLSGPVGKGGRNELADVMLVQQLLNDHVAALGLPTLVVDGDAGPNTIEAIRRYQKLVVGIAAPDGRIDPGGRTWTALEAGQTVLIPPPPASNSSLSGTAWWHANQARFPNSNKLVDLVPPFRDNAIRFTSALISAGATISVSSTLRHRTRAFIMHFCWRIAKGLIDPRNVPANSALNIVWDHGNLARSKQAAREMVALFGMKHIAALNSNHIKGEAIDMTIRWSGTIQMVDNAGQAHAIGAPRNGADNSKLHQVGRTYGVKKLIGDDPHWSLKGD